MSSFVHKVHAMSQPFTSFTSVNCIVNEITSFQIRLQSLGMENLTGQLTGKLVKVDNLPVYRWSSKSLQFPALLIGQWLICLMFLSHGYRCILLSTLVPIQYSKVRLFTLN